MCGNKNDNDNKANWLISINTNQWEAATALLIQRQRTLGGRLPVEPLLVLAVVIDHVLAPYPHQLTLLCVAQLAVSRRSPPVRRGTRRTLRSAALPVRTSSQVHLLVSRREWSVVPVYLHEPTSGRPAVAVPNAGVGPHRLLVGERNSIPLIVSEDSNGNAVDEPPATVEHSRWPLYVQKLQGSCASAYHGELTRLGLDSSVWCSCGKQQSGRTKDRIALLCFPPLACRCWCGWCRVGRTRCRGIRSRSRHACPLSKTSGPNAEEETTQSNIIHTLFRCFTISISERDLRNM